MVNGHLFLIRATPSHTGILYSQHIGSQPRLHKASSCGELSGTKLPMIQLVFGQYSPKSVSLRSTNRDQIIHDLANIQYSLSNP